MDKDKEQTLRELLEAARAAIDEEDSPLAREIDEFLEAEEEYAPPIPTYPHKHRFTPKLLRDIALGIDAPRYGWKVSIHDGFFYDPNRYTKENRVFKTYVVDFTRPDPTEGKIYAQDIVIVMKKITTVHEPTIYGKHPKYPGSFFCQKLYGGPVVLRAADMLTIRDLSISFLDC